MTKPIAALAFALVLAAGPALAAAPRTYQVTGFVLEVSDEVIVVQKGKERFEIARSKDTQISGGDLKVGAKVTIEYRMSATTVDVKGGAAKSTPDEAAGAKTAKAAR